MHTFFLNALKVCILLVLITFSYIIMHGSRNVNLLNSLFQNPCILDRYLSI